MKILTVNDNNHHGNIQHCYTSLLTVRTTTFRCELDVFNVCINSNRFKLMFHHEKKIVKNIMQ